MKRIISILLVICLLFQITACGMSETVSTAKDTVVVTAEKISENVSEKAEAAKDTIASTAENISTEVSEKAEVAKENIATAAENVSAELSEKAEAAKETITSTAENISTEVSEKAEVAKENIANAAENISAEVSDKAELAKETLSNTAENISAEVGMRADMAKETISNTAGTISAAVSDWWENIDLSVFENGWNTAVNFVGSYYAAAMGSDYVQKVGESINAFKNDMNKSYYSARGVAQEAGFAAERWAADTFNIDAAVRGSSEKASVVGSNAFGSVDVTTSYGENASFKYYNNASDSAAQQAQTIIQHYTNSNSHMSLEEYINSHGYDIENTNALFESIYKGQTRIIPADQLEKAKEYLKGKITDPSDPELANYLETLQHLKDRLEAPDGTKSIPATYDEMQAITEICQKGEFKPEDFGFKLSQIITPKYVVKQAIGAGASAATIELVLELGPDIFSIVKEALRGNGISEAELKEMGIDGVLAASEGFIEGSVSCALLAVCQAGKLGEEFVNASPDIIGTLTVILIDAIRYGYALAKGEINGADYGNLIAEEILIAAVQISSGTLLAMLFGGAGLAYMVGSFAGSLLAAVGLSMAKELVLEIKDGGGFESVVPVNILDSISVAKDTVSNLNVSERLSNFKDMVVSTANDGLIMIKSVVA